MMLCHFIRFCALPGATIYGSGARVVLVRKKLFCAEHETEMSLESPCEQSLEQAGHPKRAISLSMGGIELDFQSSIAKD